MKTYRPRRAAKRWLAGAPEYILDCFDHPKFADRYTVLFGGSLVEGGGTLASTWMHGLGTSADGHVSGSFELKAYQCSSYRYANRHRRITWESLPEQVKRMARSWAETDEAAA